MRDIYNHVVMGHNTKAILRADPGIRPQTLVMAHILLATTFPAQNDLATARLPSKNYKILVDENISPRAAAMIPPSFGHVITIKQAGLCGWKDAAVWDWAVNEKCDAILTQDWRHKDDETDLTNIAIRAAERTIDENNLNTGITMKELPMLIHLNIRENIPQGVAAAFNEFEYKIKAELDNMTMPYMELTTNGLQPGPSYDQVARKLFGITEFRTRAEQRETKWKQKILERRAQPLDTGEQRQLDKTIRAAVQYCARIPRTVRPF